MSTTTSEWVPFSSRYGYRTHLRGLGHPAFASRHTHDAEAEGGPWSHCERDRRLRCTCPGDQDHPPCCHRASGEDRLCDACRRWCHAVDAAGRYHRFVDLYAEPTPATSDRSSR